MAIKKQLYTNENPHYKQIISSITGLRNCRICRDGSQSQSFGKYNFKADGEKIGSERFVYRIAKGV